MEISGVMVTLRARELPTGEVAMGLLPDLLEGGFVGSVLDLELGGDFGEAGQGRPTRSGQALRLRGAVNPVSALDRLETGLTAPLRSGRTGRWGGKGGRGRRLLM